MADPRHGIPQKWRPPLVLVIGLSLLTVLAFPVFGFLVLRWITDDLGWRVSVLIVSFGMLFATLVVGYIQWRVVVRPIWDMVDSINEMGRAKDSRPPLQGSFGTQELTKLGGALLDLSLAVEARQRALEGYADHVVHELKSPVTAARAAAELMVNPALSADQKVRLGQELQSAIERMDLLLNALRDHSKSLLEEVSGECFIADLEVAKRDNVNVFGRPKLPLTPNVAQAVFEHFLENSLHAGATRLDICESGSGIIIGDNGAGFETRDAERAFDPFFTTKRARGGTGMGLTICKTLLESGGCKLLLWQKSGGAAFSIHVEREFVSKTSLSLRRPPF